MVKYLIFAALFALSALVGFNCSHDKFEVLDSLPSSDHDVFVVPQKPSLAVLTKEQVLESMLSVAGVDYTPAIRTTYEKTKGSFTITGGLDTTNAPMMLSLASLSGEVCATLVAQEKNLAVDQRQFFYAIDFTKGIANITDGDIDEILRGFARAFWGRIEKDAEYDALAQLLIDYETGPAAEKLEDPNLTVPYLTTLCTAMLATPDFLYY